MDLDFLPPAERRAYHESAVRRILQHAFVHPLTRSRFSGICERELRENDPIEILGQISATNSSDHSPGILQDGYYGNFVSTEGNSPIVFSTGGTTGRPKLLMNSYDETLHNAVFHGKGYFCAGIRQTDTVATFGGSGIYASEYCVYHALSQTGCTIVPINDFRNTEENIKILQELKVNTLLAMPSELFAIVERLESYSQKLNGVVRVVTGGEKLSEQLQFRLRRCLNETVAFGSTFQTADLGTIGYQCPSCRPDEYHVHEELQYVQIANNEDSEGTLIVTNLDRLHMPVLRTFSGDLADWVDERGACGCGRYSRKILIKGRTTDIIKIGGEKVNSSILLKIPEVFEIPENRINIEISLSEAGRDTITIYCDHILDHGLKETVVLHLMSDPKLAQMRRELRFEEIRFRRSHKAEVIASGSGKFRILKDKR